MDTVTRIRGQLEVEGVLPLTRWPGIAGGREITSPKRASSLSEFLELLPALEAAYVARFGSAPLVHQYRSMSFADLLVFSERWTEDVGSVVTNYADEPDT